MSKVEQALKSAIEEIKWADHLHDWHEGLQQALKQCKVALAEIEKCEPVGEVVMVHDPEWMKPREGFKWYQTEFPLGTKFYTSPQPKEWVGLSDYDIENLAYSYLERVHPYSDYVASVNDLRQFADAYLKQLNAPDAKE